MDAEAERNSQGAGESGTGGQEPHQATDSEWAMAQLRAAPNVDRH